MTTYADIVPLVDTLNHSDKLRLAQVLVQRIAAEGIETNLLQSLEIKTKRTMWFMAGFAQR